MTSPAYHWRITSIHFTISQKKECADLAFLVSLYSGQDEILRTITALKSFAVIRVGRSEFTVHLLGLSIIVFSEAMNAYAAAEVPEILKGGIKRTYKNQRFRISNNKQHTMALAAQSPVWLSWQ